MLKVGITGGIGSGKTTVCAIFETLGIPVYYADDAARALMGHDEQIIGEITRLFGQHIYAGGTLDRAALASTVFGDEKKLAVLNAIVHPVTINAASEWMAVQKTAYAIKEAAIFFESGAHYKMDVMIGVSAPKALRIARTIARSGMSEADVLARMARQMDDEEKMRRCDFVIQNDDQSAVIPQVLKLHETLTRLASGKG